MPLKIYGLRTFVRINDEDDRLAAYVGGDSREKALDRARLFIAASDLLTELRDFHTHAIDEGFHACENIPGGCPVLLALKKVEE